MDKMAREFKTFFSYYGSKAKIIQHYPFPKYDTIVEPFCGAATYSVKHFERQIYLCDLNKDIIDTWEFLINASHNDILSLPKFKKGLDLRTLDLSKGQLNFCGYWCSRGSNTPRNIVSTFAVGNSNGEDYFENIKKQVADNLYRIKHWKIKLENYKNLNNNIKSTWFIDPPYEKGGQHYIHNTIDYEHLKEWAISRNGEIIVCENIEASWLNFDNLIDNVGIVRIKSEGIFYKQNA